MKADDDDCPLVDKMYIAVIDEREDEHWAIAQSARIVLVLDDDGESCPAVSAPQCGSCTQCLIAQATYGGYKILYGLDDSQLAELEVELDDGDDDGARRWTRGAWREAKRAPEPAESGGMWGPLCDLDKREADARTAVGVDFAPEGDATAVVIKSRPGIVGKRADYAVDEVIRIPPGAFKDAMGAMDVFKDALGRMKVALIDLELPPDDYDLTDLTDAVALIGTPSRRKDAKR